jgi:quercetin dioxygenase-like cupin family protein
MSTNGHQNALTTLSRPPGTPGSVYMLPSLSGEVIYIPCSLSATRLLVTGKESNNAFAVVGSGGTQSAPIGFHFHRETHDVFLCLKGSVNVWANDQARTMTPGDFASVPPNTIHQYQILGTHSEFLGLIVPGGWEEFFRVIGDPYDGPLFPLSDDRNPFEVLIPRLKKAAQEFDMVPLPMHPKFEPQAWSGSENVLPKGLEAYFLKAGSGPAYLVGGTVVRPLALMEQSGGKFAIARLEGSAAHAGIFEGGKTITFEATHHCFQVAEGTVRFTIEGKSADLSAMETVYIPAGKEFRFEVTSNLGAAYVFANGGGVVELLVKLGNEYKGILIPEKAEGFDGERLGGFGKELGFVMSS